jgi:hypothetical protein
MSDDRYHVRVVALSLIETPRKRFAFWRSLGFLLWWLGTSALGMYCAYGELDGARDRVPATLLFGAVHLPFAWLVWKGMLSDRWRVIIVTAVLEEVVFGILVACFDLDLSS